VFVNVDVCYVCVCVRVNRVRGQPVYFRQKKFSVYVCCETERKRVHVCVCVCVFVYRDCV